MCAMTKPTPEPLWDIAEAAGYLRKTSKTLRNWMAHSYGPPVYVVGGSYRYDPAEVRAWVREQSVEITAGRIEKALAARAQ